MPSPYATLRPAIGHALATPLSFTHCLVRRAHAEQWRFSMPQYVQEADGSGHAVVRVELPHQRIYDLVCFMHNIKDSERSDRVIARVWDTTFSMVDGIADAETIARLAKNTPQQEFGRYTRRELVLARANKSQRVEEQIMAKLRNGEPPDRQAIEKIGYGLRTSAVYGNGKFGMASRSFVADRPEFQDSFAMEMMAVYMIRLFSLRYIKEQCGTPVDQAIQEYLGIGNATGLGMAPFLAKHAALVGNWVAARSAALETILAGDGKAPEARACWEATVTTAGVFAASWGAPHAEGFAATCREVRAWLDAHADVPFSVRALWEALLPPARCARVGDARYEHLLALTLDAHRAEVVGCLPKRNAIDRRLLDPQQRIAELRAVIAAEHGWATEPDLAEQYTASPQQWYYSADKREPRIATTDLRTDQTMPICYGAPVRELAAWLEAYPDGGARVGDALASHTPTEHTARLRHAIRYVQQTQADPAAIIGVDYAHTRPLDLLRFKLSCFGATRFDPKSDQWLRIALFQGAPLPDPATGLLATGTIPAFPVLN